MVTLVFLFTLVNDLCIFRAYSMRALAVLVKETAASVKDNGSMESVGYREVIFL